MSSVTSPRLRSRILITDEKVLNIIKGSGVTAFGFVGNEQFSEFGKAPNAPKATM